MNFLIDAQLPPTLCGWLRERGHQAVHVFEIGMVAASDAEIAAPPYIGTAIAWPAAPCRAGRDRLIRIQTGRRIFGDR